MKNFQILLIEPDHILSKVYKNYLEKFHYSVTTCADVQSAINETDRLTPDMIILEPKLSSHNGYEFLYELRSYPEWQSVTVIIHSMISEEELDISPIAKDELGIAVYLYKPATSLGKLHYELNNQLLTSSV